MAKVYGYWEGCWEPGRTYKRYYCMNHIPRTGIGRIDLAPDSGKVYGKGIAEKEFCRYCGKSLLKSTQEK